jgi:hypothetical protein
MSTDVDIAQVSLVFARGVVVMCGQTSWAQVPIVLFATTS